MKRQTTRKAWPIPRKGTKYLAKPMHEAGKGVPLVVIMRDVLKLVKNKKELIRLLNEKQVLINQKEARETNYPLLLFDVLSLPLIKKSYKVILKNKRIDLEEISDKEAATRTYKITNKKYLPKGKTQINLDSGKNILADDKTSKLKTGDFITINSKDNKILSTNSLTKGSKIIVISGRHSGVIGEIKNVKEEGQNTIAEIKTKEEDIKVDFDNLFVRE